MAIVARASWLAGVISLVWFIRQVILSGYPLFPSTFLGVPVSWRYPADKAIALQQLIHWFALWIHDKPPTHFSDWWSIWLQTRIFPTWTLWMGLVPFAAGLITLLPAVFFWRRIVPLGNDWKGVFWVIFCAFTGLVFWFRSAPDPRFISQLPFLMWAAGASLLTAAVVGRTGNSWRLTPLSLFPALPPSLPSRISREQQVATIPSSSTFAG